MGFSRQFALKALQLKVRLPFRFPQYLPIFVDIQTRSASPFLQPRREDALSWMLENPEPLVAAPGPAAAPVAQTKATKPDVKPSGAPVSKPVSNPPPSQQACRFLEQCIMRSGYSSLVAYRLGRAGAETGSGRAKATARAGMDPSFSRPRDAGLGYRSNQRFDVVFAHTFCCSVVGEARQAARRVAICCCPSGMLHVDHAALVCMSELCEPSRRLRYLVPPWTSVKRLRRSV